MSELEKTRLIFWGQQWQAVGQLSMELRREHPESFRPYSLPGRNGTVKSYGTFTKGLRLKQDGRAPLW
ncbi:hypothetical protein [Halomicronema sp. CCY15110]|uniref:hypothetical protein n=1 Tax=Halomicronema sp. CCY15110 TaxID=2767773 RepID=UPI001951B7A0|nr:hypothetical protein [Halomicronema sp. CCY15110]